MIIYLRIVLLTIFASGVSVLVSFLLGHTLGNTNPFLPCLLGVLMATWYGNKETGIATVILCLATILCTIFVPSLAFMQLTKASVIDGVFFVIIGTTFATCIDNIRNTDIIKTLKNTLKTQEKVLTEQGMALETAKGEVKARDEFLSIASHELKTPLTSMLLKIQLTLRNIKTVSLAEFSIENLMQMLQSTEAQTMRLSKMISDLLNVSLIASGKVHLEKEKVDLKTIVQDVIEGFSERLAQENVQLASTLESVTGNWDRIRLEQVVTNLISNAIKYGDKKPITVTLKKKYTYAYIEVTDHGIGIPKDQQKHIFALFDRGNVSEKMYKGLGVGLYITNQIIRAHNGEITVKSKQGGGSTFIITLPLYDTR